MCIDLYTSELFAVVVGFSVEGDRDDIFADVARMETEYDVDESVRIVTDGV